MRCAGKGVRQVSSIAAQSGSAITASRAVWAIIRLIIPHLDFLNKRSCILLWINRNHEETIVKILRGPRLSVRVAVVALFAVAPFNAFAQSTGKLMDAPRFWNDREL